MSNVAYVRVSTEEQNEARQKEALAAHNIDKWFEEKASGKNTHRPAFQQMMDWVREGDTVFIHDLSRIARSTKDLLSILDTLDSKGVRLVSNKESIDTSTATGKLIVTVIGAINEFERANMLERQREGIPALRHCRQRVCCHRQERYPRHRSWRCSWSGKLRPAGSASYPR